MKENSLLANFVNPTRARVTALRQIPSRKANRNAENWRSSKAAGAYLHVEQ